MARPKEIAPMGAEAPAASADSKAFDDAALAYGAIPKNDKEPIALGVALTTHCGYCLDVHRKAALAAGITPQEMSETVFVAAAPRAGAAVTHGTHLVA